MLGLYSMLECNLCCEILILLDMDCLLCGSGESKLGAVFI